MFLQDYFIYLIGLAVFIIALIWILIIVILIKTDSDLTLFFNRILGVSTRTLGSKVVWVSGASTGLGEAIAIKLGEVGAKIVITGNENTHEEVKAKCIQASNGLLKDEDILAIPPFDIRDVDAHESIVEKVIKHFGRIDILINNVGMTQRANFDTIPHKVEKDIMDINVLGQINLTKCVIRHFKKRKTGQLAATISVCGKFACPFSASYDASKFALIGYFDCIRNEYPFIDVTLVCPGPIMTQNISKAYLSGDFVNTKKSYDSSDKRMPVDRAATLYLLAVANRLDEVWFSLKPILWLFYAAQYFPSTFRK